MNKTQNLSTGQSMIKDIYDPQLKGMNEVLRRRREKYMEKRLLPIENRNTDDELLRKR